MIDALIALVWVCGYVTPALFTARDVYCRGRAKNMDKLLRATDFHGRSKYTLNQATRRYEEWDRGDDLIKAFAYGSLWPILGVGWWIGRWFDATAPESAEESKARIRELERENARLERELGIGSGR